MHARAAGHAWSKLHSHDYDRAMSIGHRNYGTKPTLVYITATVSQVSVSRLCS